MTMNNIFWKIALKSKYEKSFDLDVGHNLNYFIISSANKKYGY